MRAIRSKRAAEFFAEAKDEFAIMEAEYQRSLEKPFYLSQVMISEIGERLLRTLRLSIDLLEFIDPKISKARYEARLKYIERKRCGICIRCRKQAERGVYCSDHHAWHLEQEAERRKELRADG